MSFANNTSHMLLILIPIAWMTVVIVFVAISRSAARGDDAARAQPERSETAVRSSIDGLVLWEDPAEVALRDMRPRKPWRLLAGHGLTHHGVR